MTLRTLNYGNYGISLIMGDAGFISSTVLLLASLRRPLLCIRLTVLRHLRPQLRNPERDPWELYRGFMGLYKGYIRVI